MSNANLIFKFNDKIKQEKPTDDVKIIKEYHNYLKMKQEFGYKSFFERKKEQLKDWLIGLLAEKTSLFIKNVNILVFRFK